MLRAVLDTHVYVASLLSGDGSPARIVRALNDGVFDAVVCPILLTELTGVLARPKLSDRIPAEDARAFVAWLGRVAVVASDPSDIVAITPDPGDDYLLALAHESGAGAVVSGDAHLLGLAHARHHVLAPAVFADLVDSLR